MRELEEAKSSLRSNVTLWTTKRQYRKDAEAFHKAVQVIHYTMQPIYLTHHNFFQDAGVGCGMLGTRDLLLGDAAVAPSPVGFSDAIECPAFGEADLSSDYEDSGDDYGAPKRKRKAGAAGGRGGTKRRTSLPPSPIAA